MIPVLYEAKETKFRSFGLGEIADAYEIRVTRERNGNYSLYIKYPLDGVFASVFKEEMKIKSDAGRRTKWQTFEINRVLRNSKDHIEIFARHISMRTQDIALKPFVNGASVGAESALEIWKENLVGDDTFDVKSDILTLGSFYWEADKIGNARGALGGVAGSILDVYGGEYEFDNRTIILRKQMGRKAPTVLEYGRNIVSVEEERLLDGNTTVNGAFTTKIANAIKIKADQIIAGVIDAAKIRVINLNASSIAGLDANFIKARIGYAITDLLEGKVIKARNSAMLIDLNTAKMDFNSDATINFNSKNNALVRRDGTHTAFVHFSNATPKGYTGSALYASIGITSSGDGVNSASSGRFAGLRSFRYATGYNHTAAVDQTEIYGDNVLVVDDFNITRGFKFRPDKMQKMLDMNDLYAAVVALGRCWGHLANVGWNTAHSNFTSAVNRELNNYITKI
ncbi:Phage infection protein [Streptococcus pyogenes]|nr:phage tail spike protein [Streptococcus pyogenes]VHE95670.1 Phage infection protein [Streptococcus pyogenes]VHF79710.1 Phage infection protein [Streptococcus pyogenes]